MNPLCEFEGQMNCIWLSNLRGNKGGKSFIDVMGTQLYAEELVFIVIMLIMAASIAIIIFDAVKETS